MKQNGRLNYKLISTIIKYIFSLLITCLTMDATGEWKYVTVALTELCIVVFVSDWIMERKPIAGQVLNCVLCLVYNVQVTILFFSNSFLLLVMLTNIASVQALGGKAFEYGLGLILVLFHSVLPICSLKIRMKKPGKAMLPIACTLECLLLCFIGVRYSPALGYFQVATQAVEILQLKHKVENIEGSAFDFYSPEIEDHVHRDPCLPDYPNVILIFAEGLSQNIISDERNIMPNLSALQAKSISFSNYYNHTFATYRGLSGQLYSGYQLENLDENNLISIQDILRAYQYHTTFINTEPANPEFTEYLNTFDFDEVLGSVEDRRSGMTESYSDKEAYEMLFDTACSLEKADTPYFLCIYTYGTHVSFDSVDAIYGDGTQAVLNKFYNLDIQLGLFLDRFDESDLFDDTVLVFTTDHATYQDRDFSNTFPHIYRASSMVDEIPLCIYYKGVMPQSYDVQGRNSLDLVPTILDYLDISYPNYFLGTSLFADNKGNESLFDTTFNEEAVLLNTTGGIISAMSDNDASELTMMIQQYFVAKKKDITDELTSEVNGMFNSGIELVISSNGTTMEITYRPKDDEDYNQIWFPVWSSENNQDDKIVYPAYLCEDGSWRAVVDLTKHTVAGELNVHVYGGETDATDLLSSTVEILK